MVQKRLVLMNGYSYDIENVEKVLFIRKIFKMDVD